MGQECPQVRALGKSDTSPPKGPPGRPCRLPQCPPIPSAQVSQALVRLFSSTARNRLENRVAEKQKLFQVGGEWGGAGEEPGRRLLSRRELGWQELKVCDADSAFHRVLLKFQEDNGLPVHLKGGATDNILYQSDDDSLSGGECRARPRPELREEVAEGAALALGLARELDSELVWTLWELRLTNTGGAPRAWAPVPGRWLLVMHLGRKPEAWSVSRSSISPAEGQFGKGLELAAWAQKQDGLREELGPHSVSPTPSLGTLYSLYCLGWASFLTRSETKKSAGPEQASINAGFQNQPSSMLPICGLLAHPSTSKSFCPVDNPGTSY